MTVDAIDIVVNPLTPQEVEKGQTGYDEGFMEQVRMPEEMRKGLSLEQHIEIMDAASVDHALLIAVRAGDPMRRSSFEIPYQQIADYVARFPPASLGWPGLIQHAVWSSSGILSSR